MDFTGVVAPTYRPSWWAVHSPGDSVAQDPFLSTLDRSALGNSGSRFSLECEFCTDRKQWIATMAYDENSAERVRRFLSGTPDVREIKMMGALIFMVNDNMCCGVTGTALMVRVGPAAHEAALRQPHVGPMTIAGGRRLRAFVRVEPEGYATDAALAEWVGRGIAFVSSLPRRNARDGKPI
jgi:hypothetical protein